MNRRTFVQTAAACAALHALPGLARAADSPAPKRRIRIGFLGATYSHGPDKIKLTLSSPDWECVGVCDESPAARKTAEQLGAHLISENDLFDRAEVVAVESDVEHHAADALRALNAGKHIHLEKPPAMRLDQMRAIIELARKKKRLVQTGFMWRYNPGFSAIFEAVRHGWLGDVYLVRGWISNYLAPARRSEWSGFKGGAMFELGSHLIDATVRLLGRPKAVTPFLRRHGPIDDQLKDNNVVVLEYEKASAVIINTALQASASPQRSFEVIGSNGSAALQPIEPPTLSIDLAKAAGPYMKGAQKVPLPPYQRYVGDFAELSAAVRGDQPLRATLDEELLVAEMVLRAGDMI